MEKGDITLNEVLKVAQELKLTLMPVKIWTMNSVILHFTSIVESASGGLPF